MDVIEILKSQDQRSRLTLASVVDGSSELGDAARSINSPPGSAEFSRITARISQWGPSADAAYRFLSSVSHPSLRSASSHQRNGQRPVIGQLSIAGQNAVSPDLATTILGNALQALAMELSKHLRMPETLSEAVGELDPEVSVVWSQQMPLVRATSAPLAL